MRKPRKQRASGRKRKTPDPKFKLDFGRRLEVARASRYKSAAELARALDLTSQAVTAYERGERLPDYETLLRIIQLTDFSADYFIGAKPPA
jgi:transcriptional regulator with XRE-family HTH domain